MSYVLHAGPGDVRQVAPATSRSASAWRRAPRFYDEELSALLSEFGVWESEIAGRNLLVAQGARVELQQLATGPLLQRELRTDDLDQLKRWIGVPDRLIESGYLLPPPDAPTGRWAPAEVGSSAGPSVEEWRDLERAVYGYLFGSSARVREYRTAIDRHFAPYLARLIVADRIEIEPEATLVVAGYPALIVVRELIIHAGGCLRLSAPTKLFVDVARKL